MTMSSYSCRSSHINLVFYQSLTSGGLCCDWNEEFILHQWSQDHDHTLWRRVTNWCFFKFFSDYEWHNKVIQPNRLIIKGHDQACLGYSMKCSGKIQCTPKQCIFVVTGSMMILYTLDCNGHCFPNQAQSVRRTSTCSRQAISGMWKKLTFHSISKTFPFESRDFFAAVVVDRLKVWVCHDHLSSAKFLWYWISLSQWLSFCRILLRNGGRASLLPCFLVLMKHMDFQAPLPLNMVQVRHVVSSCCWGESKEWYLLLHTNHHWWLTPTSNGWSNLTISLVQLLASSSLRMLRLPTVHYFLSSTSPAPKVSYARFIVPSINLISKHW